MKQIRNLKSDRRRFQAVFCLFLCVGLPSLQAQTPGLTYPVPIDWIHFPCEKFRNYVSDFDIDGNQELSVAECGSVVCIDLPYRVTNLEGIKYFYALEDIDAYGEEGALELDLSGCTTLESLTISGGIGLLDVSGCTALRYLDCTYNDLESLDASGCTALSSLYCSNNKLESLDVSGCTALSSLDCSNNKLESLDVSGCTALSSLDCSNNKLESLDVPDIYKLDCSNNLLKSLTIRYLDGEPHNNASDFELNCSNNLLEEITIVNPQWVGDLDCSHNKLKNLDETRMEYLHTLDCSYNCLTDLDFAGLSRLDKLDCSHNKLEKLLLPGMWAYLGSPNAEYNCSYNDLDTLTFPRGAYFVVELNCAHNRLSELIMDFKITSGSCWIDCSHNDIERIDLPTADMEHYLLSLDCSYNRLASLDISHAEYLLVDTLTYNFNYHEIVVDEYRRADLSAIPDFDPSKMSNVQGGILSGSLLYFEDDTVSYFYDTLSDPFYLVLPITIDGRYFPDPAFRDWVDNVDSTNDKILSWRELQTVEYIDVSGLGIRNLRGIQYFSRLKGLDCHDNLLVSIDLDGVSLLQTLNCSDNQLESLSVGDLTDLRILDCSGNNLTHLDVGNLHELRSLDCSRNYLFCLDLSGNPNLRALNTEDNRTEVTVGADSAFELSSLHGFDVSRASGWTGGTVSGNVLTFNQDEASYKYRTGYPGWEVLSEVRFYLQTELPDPEPGPEPTSEIALDEAHFPDDIFREYLSNHADLSQNGSLSEQEIAVLTVLDVSGMGIRWLKGIEYLTAIRSLDCSGNELVSLDLSKNTNLQTLNVVGNRRDVVIDDRNQLNVSTLWDGFSRHKATDFEGGTLDMTTLTFVQQEVTYSYATNYVGSSDDASLKSVRFSLMADRDPSVGNEVSDLQPQGRIYAKDHVICTEGIETEISIYSASGSLLYRGFDKEIPVRHDGLYLVRSGDRTWKVLVM